MASHDGLSDSELVTRCQSGNLDAFDILVRRHERRAFNIAYRVLGDRDAAHDATQDAFLAAYRALPKFRGQSAFSTWLYRILHNACLDASNKRKRRGEVSLNGHSDDEPGPPEVPDPGPGPDAELERDELGEAVHTALGRLALHHRELLTLFDIEGMAYQEICDILGLRMGTVKSRLNRARHALRRELEPMLEQVTPGDGHTPTHASDDEGRDRDDV